MPIQAHMWINDGKIKGGCKIAGREDSVEIQEFHHEVRIPVDSDTGGLTGTRKHEAFTVVKEFDKSSPYFYKAVCTGQTWDKVVIKWYDVTADGTEEVYFIHTLEKVKVCAVRPYMPNIKDRNNERYKHLEAVDMRYEKITWTYGIDENSGTKHSDAWAEKGEAKKK